MKIVRIVTLIVLAVLAGGSIGAQSAPAKSDKSSKSAKSSPAGALIDINHASAADLKALPGVGDAYSAAIIRNRPYANKAQLVSRKVISESLYQKIKDQIIAKQ